jgi:hypothetical protein
MNMMTRAPSKGLEHQNNKEYVKYLKWGKYETTEPQVLNIDIVPCQQGRQD